MTNDPMAVYKKIEESRYGKQMQFNIFNTQLTSGKFNANTPQEHMHLIVCLEQLVPKMWRALGELFTNKSELDLVVYDLYDYGTKDNITALFNTDRRLLGIINWATMGMVAVFKSCPSIHRAPY
ncbi:hypothetical protein ARMGADRAFT_1037793 [Armillaria gallica]|uniref:Uncharacterized protein n=1 Tax=Armillaria gallica TaxID=47427 RepID=A0A2H3D3L4_ARMGA|nr:hypothetical protein ARMGADRAFT_1037793 [Armillaria gallica]